MKSPLFLVLVWIASLVITGNGAEWLMTDVIKQKSNRGEFGTWGGFEYCKNGVFANGFMLRAEKDQGIGDDTGANAVCLKCGKVDTCSKQGSYGDWSEPQVCPEGSFLSGWRQNVEPYQGWGILKDDTSLNNVEYRCRDSGTWGIKQTLKTKAKEWGKWSRWAECPSGEFICGIETRVEDPDGDDTALNDIKHQCCKPDSKKKKAKEDVESRSETEEENAFELQEEAESGEGDELQKRGDQMMTNIGYLFKGYNMLEGNPTDPDRAFDPGFRTKIFEATYDKNRQTDDYRYKIPDNVDIVGKESCSAAFSAETVMTESDYQKSLLAKASVTGSGNINIVKASFTASAEYSKTSKRLKTNKKSIIKSEATCTVYEARIQTGTPPKLSENFIKSVKYWSETQDYGKLLDTFGTHFVEAVDMGARFTRLQEISKENQEKMRKSGIDIKLAAEASATGIGKLSTDNQLKITRENTEKFEKSVESTRVVTIGSKPPSDGKQETWIAAAIDRPLPTFYQLNSITELFTPNFFQESDGVDYKKIRQELSAYLKGYCQKLKSGRLQNLECDGPPKGCSGGSQCSANARCVDSSRGNNNDQQYECTCNPGYEGDGVICDRRLKWKPTVVIEHDDIRSDYGTWGGLEFCKNGVFASGFLLKAEEYKKGGDDTGANAVCLKCAESDICSKKGQWGKWSDPFMCPENSYMSGWRQNIQEHKGWGLLRDDTGMDNVEYKCRDVNSWSETATLKGDAKERGRWSRWKECPRGEFICGIDTRVRDPGGDDTALNDIKHQCCQPTLKKKAKAIKRAESNQI